MSKLDSRTLYDCCPLCNADNIVQSLLGDCSKHHLYNEILPSKMQWMDCNECGHQFIDGYFTDAALEIIFNKTHDNQKVGFQVEAQRKISAKIVEKVLPYKSSGTWVDIGFGNGSLLFTADEFGFDAVGIDLRKDNVEHMNHLGFQAHCQLAENVEFEKAVSVISLMDVLEHVPYPKEVLSSLYPKMEDDGCLMISMPNTENLIWKLMTEQNQNPYLGELEHYHNFSRTRLFSLLKECGFEAVKYGISERYRVCMEIIAIRK